MSTSDNPFNLNPMDLTTVFIDGPNLYGSFRQLDGESNVNYATLRNLINDNCRLQGICYYTAIKEVEEGEDDYSPIVKLTDYIANNGYRVFKKTAKKVNTDLGMKLKGSVNVDIGCAMIRAAFSGTSHIVLFASDNEMLPAVVMAQELGCKVTLVSSRTEHIVSDDLRRAADEFVDLKDILGLIRRDTPKKRVFANDRDRPHRSDRGYNDQRDSERPKLGMRTS